MFRLVIKLAVAALLAHGVVRIVPVFWTHVRFTDALEEAARFAGKQTEEQLQAKAAKIAEDLEVPIAPEAIKVRRAESRTLIDTSYVAPLEYFPTKFYPWEFTIHVDEAQSRVQEMLR